jgi:hypothetical protein
MDRAELDRSIKVVDSQICSDSRPQFVTFYKKSLAMVST